MRTQFVRLCVLTLVLAVTPRAFAQTVPGGLGQFPTQSATSTRPPKGAAPHGPNLFGFTLDYSLLESSGLNAQNYNNSLGQVFEAGWDPGRLFLQHGPFKTLSVGLRFVLTDDLAGFDPSAIPPGGTHGEPTPCSNLVPSQGGSVVITDSTVNRCSYPNTYRPLPSDLALTIANPGIYTIPVLGILINPSIRGIAPTSFQSQYATLMGAIQGALGISRPFFGGKLSVGYSFGATKYFDRYTAPIIQASQPNLEGFVANNYTSPETAQNDAAFYASDADVSSPGGFNNSYEFSHVFAISYRPTKKLSFSATYILTDSFSYAAACGAVEYGGVGGVVTNPCTNANTVAQSNSVNTAYGNATQGGSGIGSSTVDIHDTQIFWAQANYQVTSWVGLNLSWINAGPLRTMANGVFNPFISTNYNAFTNISLGATFSLGHED